MGASAGESGGRRVRDEPDPDLVALGRTIRGLREQTGRTLSAVASEVGVSRSLISAVELGKAAPSITTLRGISEALDVPLAAFFTHRDNEDASADRNGPHKRMVVRRKDRRRLYRSGSHYELLTPDIDREIEFLWVEFDPGSGAPPEQGAYSAHAGEENALCLSGSVVYDVDGQKVTLESGDSISFDCSVPHRVENTGTAKASVVIAITPPSF